MADAAPVLASSHGTSRGCKAKGTIQHIFEDVDWVEDSVVRRFRTAASDGKVYEIAQDNLV